MDAAACLHERDSKLNFSSIQAMESGIGLVLRLTWGFWLGLKFWAGGNFRVSYRLRFR